MHPTIPVAALLFACAATAQSRALVERLQRDDWAERNELVASLPIAQFADALAAWPDALDTIDLRVRSVIAQRRDELLELWCDEPLLRQARAPVFARLPSLMQRVADCDAAELRDLDAVAEYGRRLYSMAAVPLWLEHAGTEQRLAAWQRLVAAAAAAPAWRSLYTFEPNAIDTAPKAPLWNRPPRVDLAAPLAAADPRVAARAAFLLRRGLLLDLPTSLRERLAQDPALLFCRAAAPAKVTESIASGWLVAIEAGLSPVALFADCAPDLSAVSPALRLRLASRVFAVAKRELAASENAPSTALPGAGAADAALRATASVGAEGLTMVLGLAASAPDGAAARRATTAAAASMSCPTAQATDARIDGLLLGLLDHADEHVAIQSAMVMHKIAHAASATLRESLWQRAQLALDRGITNLGMPLREEWCGALRHTAQPIARDVSVVLASAAVAETRLLPALLAALPNVLDGRPAHVVDSEHLRFLLACFEHLAPHVDAAQAQQLFDQLHTGAEPPGPGLLSRRCRALLITILPVVPAQCLPWYQRQAKRHADVRLALQEQEGKLQPAPAAEPAPAPDGSAAPSAAQHLERLRTAAASRLWRPIEAAQVLHALEHGDAQVRLAAYEALLSRDPNVWLPALLVFEARFDPDAAVRAFGERLAH